MRNPAVASALALFLALLPVAPAAATPPVETDGGTPAPGADGGPPASDADGGSSPVSGADGTAMAAVDPQANGDAPSELDAAAFAEWLQGLREDAAQAGVSDAILDQALAGVAPIPRVIELDRKQPEGTMTFQQYLDRIVTPGRVAEGRRLLATHGELLEAVGAAFGVQPRFIVALWGIETSFGRNTGGFNVVASLATLAYEGRRASFFRKELLNALTILEQGHIAPGAMKGSWAGAMGQCQFMPSSFLAYAVDHDGDGRRDIWDTQADVFASTANYLRTNGWNGAQTWGREVRLPAAFDPALIDRNLFKYLSEWRELGVRRADGRPIPVVEHMRGSLVQPGGPDGPTYLVYDNYRTILHWNRSLYFATAVGLLADGIGGR